MFTVQYLNSLQSLSTPKRYYEKATRAGFGIQVSPKGTKTFFYGYKIDGKQRFMKLGIFGKIDLKGAGAEWQKWYNVKQLGQDPQTVRDNESRRAEEEHSRAETIKRIKAMQGTYSELLESYIAKLRADKKVSAGNVEGVINANAYKIIARSTKAKDVTSSDINKTLLKIENRGAHTTSNRLRAYLSASFNHAIKSDTSRSRTASEIKYGISINPVLAVAKSETKEKPVDRFLNETEVKELWYSLPKTSISQKIQSALKLILITGQRSEEVLRLNINDIDFSTQLWELSETKAGRPHAIPLPPLALEVINSLQADNEGFLLSSDITGDLMPSNSLAQAISRYCKQSNFDKFTPRDLRRTWKTLAGKAGISKFNRDRYQNHAMNDVSSEHYDRYDYLAEKREVATVWNDYLKNIIYESDNVVVLLRKA